MAISGDKIVVGAPGDDVQGESSGTGYFFNRISNNWFFRYRYTPYLATAEDSFGVVVDIADDHAIVGSKLEDKYNYDAPFYRFQHNGQNWYMNACWTKPLSRRRNRPFYSVLKTTSFGRGQRTSALPVN